MEINNLNEEIVKRKHIHTMHLLTRMRHVLYICIDMEGCPWHIIQWKKLALEHCTCIIPCIQKEMCIRTIAHIYIPIHTQIYNAYIFLFLVKFDRKKLWKAHSIISICYSNRRLEFGGGEVFILSSHISVSF